ncbi:MAG: sigma-70 family RNA polymerase sigma factor [Gemmataceae bacterium]|nr:sigma-70 family RNA polymerase sigma factor [Gemmataceae bacterium]
MALTAVDKALLQRCLKHDPGSWNDFIDRFLGLIYHVIHYTAHLRSVSLSPEDVEDIAAEILSQIVANDYQILRQFRGQSSLATYLTVVCRRLCLHELTKRQRAAVSTSANVDREERPKVQAGLENLEEVERLLRKLPSREREVVRLFYLEGRTYEEISNELHIPVNSIGPVLSRAKKRLRRAESSAPASPRPGNGKAES